jgi:hypothetical protein
MSLNMSIFCQFVVNEIPQVDWKCPGRRICALAVVGSTLEKKVMIKTRRGCISVGMGINIYMSKANSATIGQNKKRRVNVITKNERARWRVMLRGTRKGRGREIYRALYGIIIGIMRKRLESIWER